MENKSRFELGDLVAGRYQLTKVMKEDFDYCSYICNYDGCPFFVKIYDEGIYVNENIFNVIKSLAYTHITRVIDNGVYKNHYCIVRPYYSNGSLFQISPVNHEYLIKEVIPIINEALKIIHNSGISHGKIRPYNLFYSDFGNDIVLGEFGISISRMSEIPDTFVSEDNVIEFLSPESVNGIIGKEADYYAFGMTLYCLSTGKMPYAGLDEKEILEQIFTKNIDIPDSVNEIIVKFIRGLTVKNKNQRWGYDEVERALRGEDVEIFDDFECDSSFFDDEFDKAFNEDISKLNEEKSENQIQLNLEQIAKELDKQAEEIEKVQPKRTEKVSEYTRIAEKLDKQIEEAKLEEKEIEQKISEYTKIAEELDKRAEEFKKEKSEYDCLLEQDKISEDNGIEFCGKTYFDAKELSSAMTYNWNEAINLLYSGDISNYFKNKDKQISQIAKKSVDFENKNLGVFRFIYEVNPSNKLCYKGFVFDDLSDISEGILISNHTELYREMLELGILSYYLIKNGDTEKAERILNLEDEARDKNKNINHIVCVLMYTLSDNPVYTFDAKNFASIDEFVDYLDENSDNIDSICSRIMGDVTFFAWVDFLGYREYISDLIDRL